MMRVVSSDKVSRGGHGRRDQLWYALMQTARGTLRGRLEPVLHMLLVSSVSTSLTPYVHTCHFLVTQRAVGHTNSLAALTNGPYLRAGFVARWATQRNRCSLFVNFFQFFVVADADDGSSLCEELMSLQQFYVVVRPASFAVHINFQETIKDQSDYHAHLHISPLCAVFQ